MISICIPVYNCDVRKLVHDLDAQARELLIDYEILLIDDESAEDYKEKNKELASLENVRYKELPANIGRSAIRNMLANEAKYRYLIFMDCDAGIYSDKYIYRYAVCCSPDVVCCGGRINLPAPAAPEYLLRWKYSINREEIDAATRELNPNDSFLTFNFLIDKEIFNTIHFDETIKGYGHEDTLFGIALKKNDIQIIHIDNPLLHVELDDNITFIEKTENGIRNLIRIQEKFEDREAFTNSVRLLKTENKLSSVYLHPFVSLFFKLFGKSLLKNLKGSHPSLLLFDLYKLGYLCSIRSKK